MRFVIAIPTWNNPRQLIEALTSLVRNTDFASNIIIVNNGEPEIAGESFQHHLQAAIPYQLGIIQAPSNLGWCGGINLALKAADLKHPDGDYVFVMCNDDVLFPVNRQFWRRLSFWFETTRAFGVGTCSDYVSGYQNLNLHGMPDSFLAPLLIGFFAAYRRSALNAGNETGLDESLPGGDDYDLSIRIRKDGGPLIVDRTLYIHHRGAQTGRRVHPNYWDSQEHQRLTYNALIRKHGLRAWWETMNGTVHGLEGGWESRHVCLSDKGDLSAGLDDFYHSISTQPSDVRDHVETLKTLAASCKHVTEFGTADGTTTIALLAGRPGKLISYDIRRLPEVDGLFKIAQDADIIFQFYQMSTLAELIEETDFLYIDDLHTYDQVKAELAMHAGQVRRYIAFHDTDTCKEHDERGQTWTPTHGQDDGKPHGILPAITEFLRDHDEWRLMSHVHYNNGLTILLRVR